MPVAPRPAGSQPLFERARKRVTQRLSLAGLNTAAPGTGKIKIPSAEAPSPPSESAVPMAQGTVEVPARVLIPHIPEAVLLAGAAELLAMPQAESPFLIPLATVLPMLPSGKIEVTVGDLASWAPEGIMHPLEALGEWASQPTQLPLPEIVMRIPPESMMLRRDQKQIDTMVLSMDDPFSPEALRAKAAQARAAAEAAAQAAAAGPHSEAISDAPNTPAAETQSADVSIPPAPLTEADLPPALVGSQSEASEEKPTVPQAAAPESSVPETEPLPVQDFAPELAATTYVPPPLAEPTPDSEPTAESPDIAPDFSFTQSEEYKALLAKLKQAEQAMEESSTAPAPEAEAIPELENPVPSPEESKAVDQPAGFKFPVEVSKEDTTSQPITEEADEQPLPPSPLEAAIKASPAGLGSTFSKALGELAARKEEAPRDSESEDKETSPDTGNETARALRELLKLPAEASAEIKEVVRHIALWPGVDSCMVCGLDGLPIASSAPPGRQAPPVAAVAPKILKTLSTLMTDLGRDEPDEIAVPSGSETLHFFRSGSMIMILGCSEAHIPPIYGKTIRSVLGLLSSSGRKS